MNEFWNNNNRYKLILDTIQDKRLERETQYQTDKREREKQYLESVEDFDRVYYSKKRHKNVI